MGPGLRSRISEPEAQVFEDLSDRKANKKFRLHVWRKRGQTSLQLATLEIPSYHLLKIRSPEAVPLTPTG